MPHRAPLLALILCHTALAQLAERPRASRPQDIFTQTAQPLPTGMSITPDAAPGVQFLKLMPNPLSAAVLGQPVSSAISPDGKTLLLLTSGYNSNEAVLLYDISSNTPRFLQALPLPATYLGLAWNPNGQEFYVSGGVNDVVNVFALQSAGFARVAQIPLGHRFGLGLGMSPVVSGIAVNSPGNLLIAANYLNDSVSLVDLVARKKIAEVDLRPGSVDASQTGVAGGEYPYWVAVKGEEKAYVSSLRDREIVVLSLTGTPAVVNRIPVQGQPNKMILNQAQSLLFAALDNSDSVAVISTETDSILETISTAGSPVALKGSNPNALALSPDEQTVYVTNGGTNTVAVISLTTGTAPSSVRGLIPTGWYPDAVSVSPDGGTLFVCNSKNVPGPNPGRQYVLGLERGALAAIPVPDPATLDALTRQAEINNNFEPSSDHWNNAAVMEQLRDRIHHVIYIIKENRTYDQVLGDLPGGNADPRLSMFPDALTPNQHQLARQFVNLDNFYDSGEVSGVGWNWSTAARATDAVEKAVPVSYGGHLGALYDYEGTNRNLNVGIPDVAGRIAANPLTPNDPNQLPGALDVSAPDDSQGGIGTGYLWDGALQQGLTVRNYGCYLDLSLNAITPAPPSPFDAGVVQGHATKQSLQDFTDPYFRGFDNNYPDLFRYQEWAREFDLFVANGNLPQLSLVRLMHDHTGNFSTAQYGVDTVETQIADNDYAVGLLIEKVAQSPYKNDTLVFIVEDDAQDGPDHVDAHRSIAFVAGPYVRQSALVTDRFTTVNLVRTIKDVLGISSMGLYDGTAEPMASVFDPGQADWTFQSIVPEVLRTTKLPLPARTAQNSLLRNKANLRYAKPRHNARYWSKAMEGQNFEKEDDLDEVDYNHALWIGLKGKKVPYPEVRDGRDLRPH